MANEIVKYENRLNTTPLRQFNVREMNLFFSIASRLYKKGTHEVTLSFSRLKQLNHYEDHQAKFVKDLNKTFDKLLTLTAKTDTGRVMTKFLLFRKYSVDQNTKEVTVAVNPEFKGMFNELKHWTRFSLKEFADLNSTYSKTMFRLIKQWRTIGKHKFTAKEFHDCLDIPKSFKSGDIDRYVLRPIKIELSPIFRNLAIKKFKKGSFHKISAYEFSWDKEAKNKDDFYDFNLNYQERLNNLNANKTLNLKEKREAKRLIKKYHKEHLKEVKNNGPIIQKEASEGDLFKKGVKPTSNDKAKQALDDYKNNK